MTATQATAIEQHGRNLQAIFPLCLEPDPVKLCKRLRRIEASAAAFALRCCNGPEWPSERECDQYGDKVLARAQAILGNDPPIFLNRDPRGYALKIDSDVVRERKLKIHQDWGGYGIIAPEIDANGE